MVEATGEPPCDFDASAEPPPQGLQCSDESTACHRRQSLRDARFSSWRFAGADLQIRPPSALAGRFRLPYKYVLPAYLGVFLLGILLGLALSPATPEELEWLAARSQRLRASRELSVQPTTDTGHVRALRLGSEHWVGGSAEAARRRAAAANASSRLSEAVPAKERAIELRHLEEEPVHEAEDGHAPEEPGSVPGHLPVLGSTRPHEETH